MKIRSGFVSNSSSSSFIVSGNYENKHFKRLFARGRKHLPIAKIRRLLKRGFRETWVGHAITLHELQHKEDTWRPAEDGEGGIAYRNYGMCVACNELDEIRFLLKLQVSFIGVGHYGHETYLYRKGDKYVMKFRNYGIEIGTYHRGKSWDGILKEFKEEEKWGGKRRNAPYRKIPFKEIMTDEQASKLIEKIDKQKAKKKTTKRKRKVRK